ncbi:MAG: hypothetical protein NDJ24_00615 [Alphaproteobacteria bacterium]|nr:hypothetical protein [Alphaproteobacteria bacterium]
MNAIVLDRDQEIDSTAQVEKGTAGFATGQAIKREAEQPVESAFDLLNKMAGGKLQPGTPILQTTDLPDFESLDGRTEPRFDDDSFTVEDLRHEVAGAWGQDNINAEAFAKIEHFKVLEPATAISALRVADPASQDTMEIGVTPEGRHVVSGQDNISAAQAYSRAVLAMTSDVIRQDGVNVFGTEKDQALLLLAAQDVGLKIINPPADLPAAILAEAKAEWDAMKAATLAAAPLATPATTEAAAPAVADDVVEDAAAPEISAPAAEAPAAMATIEPTLRELADAVEVQEIPAEQAAAVLAEAGLTTETEPAAEATPVTGTEVPVVIAEAAAEAPVVDALADDGIPVLTDIVEEGVKPELLPVLAEGDVSAATYLKARDFYLQNQETLPDSNGVVHARSLVREFQNAGVGSRKAATILKALAAEGLLNKSDDMFLPVYTVPGARPVSATLAP